MNAATMSNVCITLRRRQVKTIFCTAILFLSLRVAQVAGLSANPEITFRPVHLSFQEVSQSYPSTILRTLFSSVPRRNFSIQNVTLEVESEMVLLLGDSSSGKSTILRLISRAEAPVDGTISWDPPLIVPVYLDRKPSLRSSKTVRSILFEPWSVTNNSEKNVDPDTVEAVLRQLCSTIGLGDSSLESKPMQLSPSDVYRFGLVNACMESIWKSLKGQSLDDVLSGGVPGPLLLLDELLDMEAPSTTQLVEQSLVRLTSIGAVVICATHKSFRMANRHRSITLCRGKIIPNFPSYSQFLP